MKKIRFLVIDDAAFIRELIIANLKALGHVCVGEAATLKEGVELAMATLPDIVFLDLVMPGRNGIDGARMLKDVWPEGKVILCTTVDDEQLLSRAVENGVDIVVQKPFEQKDLVSAIEKLSINKNEGAIV